MKQQILPDATATLLKFRHHSGDEKTGEQLFADVGEALLSSILF